MLKNSKTLEKPIDAQSLKNEARSTKWRLSIPANTYCTYSLSYESFSETENFPDLDFYIRLQHGPWAQGRPEGAACAG
jgi:hypothetical protein